MPLEKPEQYDPVNQNEEPAYIGDAHFSVEARLAIQLGRESISSSVTAILELVKNAYDADAERVRIRFKGIGTPEAIMVIEDDGCGMSQDDLRNYWMVIGTANKARSRKSGKNRVLTGEKGLGRLGLDRLCGTTLVQSIREDRNEGVQLNIDWTKYERDAARLEDVSHRIYSIPNLKPDPITGSWDDYPHGLRLILKDLKDEWTENALAELRAELSLLVSPFAGECDFRVELDSGMGWRSVDGAVTTPTSLMNAALWKVIATIEEDGSVKMRMDSSHHNRVYEEGPISWDRRFPGLGHIPHCGPLRFEFYFFPRKAIKLGDETISLATVRTFLDLNQGLRIYRDGFRVKPYGSPNGDGDWLRLAYRRQVNPEGVTQDDRPGNWRVGYNQVVGAIFVTREKNGELLDQTNREGLVAGKAFAHLRVFAEESIRFFELNNQDYEMSLARKPSPREQAKKQADESVRATEGALRKLNEVAELVSSLVGGVRQAESRSDLEDKARNVERLTSYRLGEIQQTLDLAKAELAETARVFREEDERESLEKDTLANLASLGILAAAFGHETLGWASSCANNAGWLERNLPRFFFFPNPGDEEHIRQKLNDTGTQARRIETFAEFSIGNVKPEKRRRTTFCLKEVIQTVFHSFDESLRVQRNIQIDVESNLPTTSCRIKGFPIDWESVLVNLITNAVWAIKQNKGGERRIRVALTSVGQTYILSFDDSGVGIAPGSEERIFYPTYSTKCYEETGERYGTGMGLTIVKNFVEQNSGGTIQAIAKGPLGGASFIIKVPFAEAEESK
jgi:signal transduction histidine kinase